MEIDLESKIVCKNREEVCKNRVLFSDMLAEETTDLLTDDMF